MAQQFVIGCGTGRCGTVSLARWLDRQPGCTVTHEALHMPWVPDYRQMDASLSALFDRPGEMAGDVALYWLPYVATILRERRSAKAVCLRRDRKETIASFEQKVGHRNHWAAPGYREGWQDDPVWDGMFPSYPTSDRRRGIGWYWDDYYACAEQLSRQFPGQFGLWELDDFNTREGQQSILGFLGLPRERWVIDTAIRENKGGGR